MTARDPKPLMVVIVGGAGAMGRWAVRRIVELGSSERLFIADIDLAGAQQVADEVGPPASAIRLDATDEEALRQVFSGCDVVLNTMGPFSLFARPILEAAIECGCDYLDIDDDWESTVEAFAFDDRVREHGCRVIKGIGGSPGVSNLCALVAARRLDSVKEIVTGWSLAGAVVEEEAAYPAGDTAGAAVEHFLIQLSGTIRAWRGGIEQTIVPLEPVNLDYPGIGAVRTYTIGHPEAVTLPRYIEGVLTSMNVTSGPEWLIEHARSVANAYDAGEISLAQGAVQLENPPRPAERGPRDRLGYVWALARGERDGQPLAVSVEPQVKPAGRMGGATGTALAAGLELLRRGQIEEAGVHAPEGVLDPDAFFGLYVDQVPPGGVLRVREMEAAGLEVLSPSGNH